MASNQRVRYYEYPSNKGAKWIQRRGAAIRDWQSQICHTGGRPISFLYN